MTGLKWSRSVAVVAVFSTLVIPKLSSCQGLSELTAGKTVRITALKSIEVPGVITVLPDGSVKSQWPFVRDKRQGLLTVQSEKTTLCIPLPDKRVIGDLVASDGETIMIRLNKEAKAVSIPREAIATIEVRTDRGHGKMGVLIGGAAGFAFGFIALRTCDEYGCGSNSLSAGWGALLAVPGALVGWAIGNGVAGERWEPVSSDRVRVSLAPRRGGAAVAVTLSF